MPMPIRFLVALFVMLMWAAPAVAIDVAKCDGAVVSLTFYRPDPRIDQIETVFSVSRGARRVTLRYSEIDFIGAECRRSILGKSFIVFQAYCGGSACRDLDNFGIVDPVSLVIVIEPNDWNRDDAARFLGTRTGAEPIQDIYSVDTQKLVRESVRQK
jgi:hypothetical protein